MAIKELSSEQIHQWSVEEKDRWWLKNVFRGSMPQLTVRSALTGMALGGLLSLTNLYVGAKTGWTLGVGITSVILAFALFKAVSSSLMNTLAVMCMAFTSTSPSATPLFRTISATCGVIF